MGQIAGQRFRETSAHRVNFHRRLAAAELHRAHSVEGEIRRGRQGLEKVFGNQKFLAILVAEGLDTGRRIQHISVESDLALDLAYLDSGDFADIAPGFEFRDETIELSLK